MRRFIVAMMLACGLQMAVPATSWAMTPEAAQKACDDLAAAAEQARVNRIKSFIPRVDPGKVFDNATQSCLANIVKFKDVFMIKTISGVAIQEFIIQMATDMLLQKCKAATDEFNRRVAEAVSDLNQAGGGYVNIGTGGVTIDPVPGVNIPGTQVDTTPGIFDGLINWGTDKSGNTGGPTP